MKYMRLGSNPDTFYTQEATRSVLSDVPTDLIIQINNTRYLLHKFPLLLKCGLFHRLCSSPESSDHPNPIPLHDIPGGEEAFEICAKFCYGMMINLSAHNFVSAIAAAKFLRMTESVSRGNFLVKLETFFKTCIVNGWKDSVIVLQSIGKLPDWSDDPPIVQRCIDAVVDKILTHPSKVTWSYTYTRPGYNQKHHNSTPKDWWTEDISDLDLDLFQPILSTVRSTKKLPPALIGEALHVYACKHLLDQSEDQIRDQSLTKKRRMLESIVSLIPSEPASVSVRFLLRLLKLAIIVGASPSIKAELVKRSGHRLDEATPSDLIFPLLSNTRSYDVEVVEAILSNFLDRFRVTSRPEEDVRKAEVMAKVAKIFDSYLREVASDVGLSVTKFIEAAESLPETVRQQHEELYRAIDIYIKEHPEMSKAERKRLCQVIDCRKLSPNTQSHAVANDRLPLRTIVQLLFVRDIGTGGSQETTLDPHSTECSNLRAANKPSTELIWKAKEQGKERTDPSKSKIIKNESGTAEAKRKGSTSST